MLVDYIIRELLLKVTFSHHNEYMGAYLESFVYIYVLIPIYTGTYTQTHIDILHSASKIKYKYSSLYAILNLTLRNRWEMPT